MKVVWTGVESSGKSLQLSVKAEEVLARNKRWFAKTGVPRTMYFNTPMAESFIEEIRQAGLKYVEFRDLFDILNVQESDIFIDELIKFFPASGSNPLSREQIDFITQGAKTGVHIYASSQDFSQVHKQFRLLVNEVYVVTKVFGSRRPIKTAPAVKYVWGLCFIRSVNPSSFRGDSATMEANFIPSFYWIMREDCERFDTSYKVPLTRLPKKIVRKQEIVGYDEKGGVEYEKTVWV